MNKRTRMPWAVLCLLSATTGLWGHQSVPVAVSVESVLVSRGASYLHLTNHTRESQTMAFSAGPDGTVNFRPLREIVVSAGAILDVSLGELAIAEGTQILHVVSTVNGNEEGPQLHEALEVSNTGIVKSTYERAFLSRRIAVRGDSVPLRVDIGGGYFDAQPIARWAFESTRESADIAVERVEEVSTYELSNLRLRQLPENGGAEGSATFAALRMGTEPAHYTRHDDLAPRRESVFGSIQGKFVVKIPGASAGSTVKQAAWGWKVRVWQKIDGTWFQMASTTVTADGTWSADFQLPPFAGFPVRVEYQPANRFLQVQDADGDIYTWGDNWPLTGNAMDIGTRSADLTKTGSAPGIDRIYQGGMALWRKFKKHGMSALRDEPIEITYPNKLSTGKCQTPSGNDTIAWSCSYSDDGKIWLIQQHATARVVQHELAHSIHSYYWDGDMPSGSAIPHKLDKCYNGGLALSEGFADFIPYWVQFDRTATNPNLNFPIENVPSNFCKGSSNEAQVAATFWDVYDKKNDGTNPIADTWNFYHEYAPVSTFLNNPGHDSMIEFMSVYTAILGQNMATPIAGLFIRNTTHLP
jgi:hypothetical protein